MRRNTALKLVGWLGVFGLAVFTPMFRVLRYEVWAGVAQYRGDLKMPATAGELLQYMEANPQARSISSLINLGILIVLAVLIGSILVALFGDAKKDEAAERDRNSK